VRTNILNLIIVSTIYFLFHLNILRVIFIRKKKVVKILNKLFVITIFYELKFLR
jgi:hypothetical protein